MNPTHVFHTPQSRSTRVIWALEEIGAPYAVTRLTREERRGPEHRARYALGRVPLIEDEAGYLFESGAIVLALADRYPDAGLNFAPGTRERELVYQWVVFVMAELEPPIVEVRETRETDPARAAAASPKRRSSSSARSTGARSSSATASAPPTSWSERCSASLAPSACSSASRPSRPT